MKVIRLMAGMISTVGLASLLSAEPPPSTLVSESVPTPIPTPQNIYNSVVKVETAFQVPDYRTPWNSGSFGGGNGTGFFIGGNRFLTNAHVVSNARRILITKLGFPEKHPAKIIHIAHDCDLALLEIENPASFRGLTPLEIDDVPQLESQVQVIGYPIGGSRLSVTRGIVSRIDFGPYSHSDSDSHLLIQIDAAINPGNSGGPVLQNGKVVGVAFQGLRKADNTGYMIPTPVIKRFLKDIEDGNYDGYTDLSIRVFPLFNSAMKKALHLPNNGQGVLVAAVSPSGSCDGVLKAGDVLLSIDGHAIDNGGMIHLNGKRVLMQEIAERKFLGDPVTLTFLHEGKKQTAVVKLKLVGAGKIYSVRYEERPRYVFFSGLVFQPLTKNLYAAHRFGGARIRKFYNDYVQKGIFQTRKDIVVLTQVKSDQVTSELGKFSGTVVNEVNGTPVRSLSHLYELLYETELPEFVIINCSGVKYPLVIPSAEIKAANERMMKAYDIPRLSNLSTK